jgi:hypothetical protein
LHVGLKSVKRDGICSTVEEAENTERRRVSGMRVGIARIQTLFVVVALMSVVITSCTGSACASTVAPTSEGQLIPSDVKPGSVTLSWGSAGGTRAEGYGVYRGPAGAADADLTLIATTDEAQSYTSTGLLSGHSYKFGVAALDVSNQRAQMITVTVTTPKIADRIPPRPPTNASVNVVAFSDSRIDVVWGASPSPDLGSYEVSRDGKLVATVERPNPQRYSDNGLKPSSIHSYSVVAIDTSGNRSDPTAARSIQTLAAGEVSIRRGPYVSSVSATAALVSWWSNIPATGSVLVAGRSVMDPQGAVQHHTVAISGLTPGRLYPYSISTGQDSATGSFRTAASAGQTFSFAAIGDFGSGNLAERDTVAGIASADTQFIQTVGDNIYPSAGAPDPDFSTTLSDFDARLYRPLAPILQTQAFFPANGNKEYYSNGAFWRNFPMPGKNHSWYSYNWGDAHILVVDTEQPFALGSPQYNYVRADLAAHQKEAWRIVAMQRPPYSSTSINSSDEQAQETLVPLFQSYRVSLVFSGNSHNYERSFPLINGAPVRGDGVTYIVTGAGGNLFTLFAAPVPAYSAFREDTSYEFVKVTVGPNELVAQAISDGGRTVIDKTTIKRRKNDTTPPSGPTNVVAARPTLKAVYLDWKPSTDDVGVTGYQVFRDGDAKAVATVSVPGFTQTNLDPSTTYRYTVQAIDAAGNRSSASPAAVAAPPDNGVFDLNGPQRSGQLQATAPTGSGNNKGGCASANIPARLPAGKQAAPSTLAVRRRHARNPVLPGAATT